MIGHPPGRRFTDEFLDLRLLLKTYSSLRPENSVDVDSKPTRLSSEISSLPGGANRG